jgi:hypothetical protein
MLDFHACLINDALDPESNSTLTKGGLEFDSNFNYANTIGSKLELDRVGLERLRIDGKIKHS